MRNVVPIGVLVCLLACSRDESKQAKVESAAGAARVTPVQPAMPADTTAPENLDGTRWRLVEIQSMSDQQGTTRPDDPNKYTLHFDSEGGFLEMRLDCDRATANHEKTRNVDGQGGNLTIAPLKVTGAPCPQPSLNDRIVRDMPFVRSYRFANGRLALALQADGGIYVWERIAK